MSDVTIGLTGKARSGKSTVAKILRRDHGFTVISFADTLRDMALAIDPVIPTICDAHEDVHDLCILSGARVRVDRLSHLVNAIGWEKAKDRYPDVRRFLQRLGTDAVRNHLGQDVWVQAWWEKQRNVDRVVAADVRFENEARAVHDWAGVVWRIERPGHHDPSGAAGHISESGIPDHLVTRTILNSGNLGDLAQTVTEALGVTP